MDGRIVALAKDSQHRFGKQVQPSLRLLAGIGVEGDAHSGLTVRHRSRVARDAAAPNLRQVHLIHAELFEELEQQGFSVRPGEIGENVTTQGIDLLGLSRGTRLRLGQEVLIEITGLRNPCYQIDTNIGQGAMAATLGRAADGSLIRKAGVMAVVIESGTVRVGEGIAIESLPEISAPLEPV